MKKMKMLGQELSKVEMKNLLGGGIDPGVTICGTTKTEDGACYCDYCDEYHQEIDCGVRCWESDCG
ncbi:MAG: hypothetical protein J7623_08175 [Chitinophaga sp.]|uniref:hypothetical protein n=1 Tax=Chitinophaga sp. TaxID=1869181 RepID=UPI001B1EBFD3|nr:hypothetical protein [Chitinophaga sp.]MBO9728597.1 hypothetical protein [Chitinophaga sp.]